MEGNLSPVLFTDVLLHSSILWHHCNDFFQGYDTLHAVGVLVDFELHIFLSYLKL
jgi:hypothetical protein